MNTTDKYLIVSDTPNMPPKDLDLSKYVGYEAESWDGLVGVVKEHPEEWNGAVYPYCAHPRGVHTLANGHAYADSPASKYNIRGILNPDYQPEQLGRLEDLDAMVNDTEPLQDTPQLTREREMELHAMFMQYRIMQGFSSDKAAFTAQADLDAYKAHWEPK